MSRVLVNNISLYMQQIDGLMDKKFMVKLWADE